METLVVLVTLFAFLLSNSNQFPNRQVVRLARAEDQKPTGPHLLDSKVAKGEKPQKLALEGNNGNWFILKKTMAFAEAAEACEASDGAKLAVLPSEQLAQTLAESIKKVSTPAEVIEDLKNGKDHQQMEMGISRRYWIGLSDQMEEGKWIWINVGKELDFDFWTPGQPDHNATAGGGSNKAEHCGSLWNPNYFEADKFHMFNDAPCSKKYYAICDKTKDLESLFNKK